MVRRDRKLVVVYIFPASGRKITKVMTLAQVHSEIERHPDYAVVGVRIPAPPAAPVVPAEPELAAFMSEALGESNH